MPPHDRVREQGEQDRSHEEGLEVGERVQRVTGQWPIQGYRCRIVKDRREFPFGLRRIRIERKCGLRAHERSRVRSVGNSSA